jgi:membrane protein implicated in regulation of membrane protease activity
MMESINYWHWFIAGVVLIVLEVFAPGAFFLWLGVSAGVVGLILVVVPSMGWESQFLIFAVISIVSIAAWRIRLRKYPTQSEDDNLNSRTKEYIGRVFHLSEPIENGYGKIQVDDSFWDVSGPDCGIDKKIKVISVDGMVLKVEPVESAE